jgi:uncharacterized membrane protein
MSLETHYGELAALATAFFWTVTALSFEFASKRVGSLAVNMIRLTLAFLLLSVLTFFSRGMVLPFDASPHAWIWLSLSLIISFLPG